MAVAQVTASPTNPRSRFKRQLSGPVLRARAIWSKWDRHVPRADRPSVKAGLRYEAKVIRALSEAFPGRFVPGVPFQFITNYSKEYAIPDGLLWSRDFKTLCVIEVKLSHTLDAYRQLYEFYVPIVKRAGLGQRVVPLEICKNYDVDVKIPGLRCRAPGEDAELIFEAFNASAYNVWVWGDRRHGGLLLG